MIKYPLATLSWDSEEIEAIQRVIASGNFTMGEYVNKFEEMFAEYCGSKYCVMVNSGSSANLLAIAALFYRKDKPLIKGDEAIVPAVSWATTFYPLYQYGLKLKFVDIDLKTLNFDLNALENSITEKARIILAANLLGNPNDYDAINKMIGCKDIILIEDNCESMGAEYNNKKAGTFGIMGTFSCFFSHHISTMEGGLIVTDNEELYHILLSLRAHGWTRNLPKHNYVTGIKSDDWFEESWNFVLPGYNVRPLELCGAVGIEQLKKLPQFISERRKNALFFKKLFDNNDFFITQKEIGTSSWFGFSLILKPETKIDRKKVIQKLNEEGIESRPIVSGNFTKNSVMKYFDYEISGNLINADILDRNGFFVGNHHYDVTKEILMLHKILSDIV